MNKGVAMNTEGRQSTAQVHLREFVVAGSSTGASTDPDGVATDQATRPRVDLIFPADDPPGK